MALSEQSTTPVSQRESYLISWCFKPSQPQRITSQLRESFIKIYTIERTNKSEIRPKEQSEKAESCLENVWNETQLKGPQRQKQTQEQNKKEWASSVDLCQRHKPHPPHQVKVSPWRPAKLNSALEQTVSGYGENRPDPPIRCQASDSQQGPRFHPIWFSSLFIKKKIIIIS